MSQGNAPNKKCACGYCKGKTWIKICVIRESNDIDVLKPVIDLWMCFNILVFFQSFRIYDFNTWNGLTKSKTFFQQVIKIMGDVLFVLVLWNHYPLTSNFWLNILGLGNQCNNSRKLFVGTVYNWLLHGFVVKEKDCAEWNNVTYPHLFEHVLHVFLETFWNCVTSAFVQLRRKRD